MDSVFYVLKLVLVMEVSSLQSENLMNCQRFSKRPLTGLGAFLHSVDGDDDA